MKKERLDTYLVSLGYFENKSKASASILAGDVIVNDEKITKAGFQINTEKEYEIRIKSMPYVSRGGFKLEKALKVFEINPKDKICLDAGASTGGFTDCLLQNGAKFVYAADVGHNQIDWKFRQHPQVKVIEGCNLKNCKISEIYDPNDEKAELLVCDVSFISLTKVLENFKNLIKNSNFQMICLIKPQFEAGKELVEKGGVVRNSKVHIDIIENIVTYAQNLDLKINNLTFSPIKGPHGNIEYLILLSDKENEFKIDAKSIVEDAFSALN
ncbi:TlyA family RNA methyltransferase [bacterium]|nr:TlyA family RNA methyltransferase [bacterium]